MKGKATRSGGSEVSPQTQGSPGASSSLNVRMFRSAFYEESGRGRILYGGQEYDLPADVADDFIECGAAYVIETTGAQVTTKNMGRPKGVKNANRSKAGNGPGRRTRNSR